MITPWGKSQGKQVLVPGITFYDTPGHGGYYVSKAVRAVMPKEYVNADGWYEEDCEWCKVALSFPHLFTPAIVDVARNVYKSYFERHGQPEEGHNA